MRAPLLIALGLAACQRRPECGRGDLGGAECRVATSAARAHAEVGGYALAFEPPEGTPDDARTEVGGFRVEGDRLVARVATLGDFTITVDGDGEPFTLAVQNLGLGTELYAAPVDDPGGIVELPAVAGSLERDISWPLGDGDAWVVHGVTPCPARGRLAVVGDVHTGTDVLAQIIERLDQERVEADAAGEPLLGLLLLGDLSTWGTADELDFVRDMLDGGTVPVASTAGNHDVYTADVDVFSREIGPANLRFELCGTRVVLLDSADAGLAPSIEARLPALLDASDVAHLVVGTHYPVATGRTGNGWSREDQQSRLLAELAVAGADPVLSGHVHDLAEYPAVPVGDRDLHQIIVGTGGGFQGTVATPRYGYLRLTLGDEVERCFVRVAEDGEDLAPARSDEPPMCP